jgi:hypothetical protein
MAQANARLTVVYQQGRRVPPPHICVWLAMVYPVSE